MMLLPARHAGCSKSLDQRRRPTWVMVGTEYVGACGASALIIDRDLLISICLTPPQPWADVACHPLLQCTAGIANQNLRHLAILTNILIYLRASKYSMMALLVQ